MSYITYIYVSYILNSCTSYWIEKRGNLPNEFDEHGGPLDLWLSESRMVMMIILIINVIIMMIIIVIFHHGHHHLTITDHHFLTWTLWSWSWLHYWVAWNHLMDNTTTSSSASSSPSSPSSPSSSPSSWHYTLMRVNVLFSWVAWNHLIDDTIQLWSTWQWNSTCFYRTWLSCWWW